MATQKSAVLIVFSIQNKQILFTTQISIRNHYTCRQGHYQDHHFSLSHPEHHFIIWGFTHWTFCLTIPKNLFLHAQSFCLILHLIKSIKSLTHICLPAFQPLWASWDMDRPRTLGALANSIRMGLTGGRSLVICSTGLLSGQAPSGTRAGGRSSRVCGAPRLRRTPSSAGLKMGKGRVFLWGKSWCSLTPASTVPTLNTPDGQAWLRGRTCQ